MEISENAKIYNFNKELLSNDELQFLFYDFVSYFFERMNDDESKFVCIYIDSDYVPF